MLRIGLDARSSAPQPESSGAVLLDVSPFYAEAGGQVGDTGSLPGPAGSAVVRDTQPVAGSDARTHDVLVRSGELRPARPSTQRSTPSAAARSRAITARPICSTAPSARCWATASSSAGRSSARITRPSTSRFRGRSPRELADIEHRVNDGIRRNLERTVALMPLADARASGAIALIDEAYSPDVRVVDFGGWSRELCGGTHVTRSGDLGAAILVSESSIGQGIRRIEMVSGESAEERWRRIGTALLTTARALKTRPEEVPERVAASRTRCAS